MTRGRPRNQDALSNPVIINQTHEASESVIGQDAPRILKSTGPASEALDPSMIEPVDRPVDPEKMAMLEFMAQPVTVRIATTTDRQAEQVFEININGRLEFFRRGETKTIPRYFVDRLARLKVTGYSQREVINTEGIKDILHDPHTGLKYDFAVVSDPHPRGREWLDHVLMEA